MKQFFCLFFTIISLACNAQDLIVKTNGEEIKAKIKSVLDKEIEYKKENNPDGPLYKIAKSEVMMIVYSTGLKDIFTNQVPPPSPVSNSMSNPRFEYSMIVYDASTNSIIVYERNEEKNKYNASNKTYFSTIASILKERGEQGWQIEISQHYIFSEYGSMSMKQPPNGYVIYLSRQLK